MLGGGGEGRDRRGGGDRKGGETGEIGRGGFERFSILEKALVTVRNNNLLIVKAPASFP